MNNEIMAVMGLRSVVREGLGLSPDAYVYLRVVDGRVASVEAQDTTPTTQFDLRLPGVWALGPATLQALTALYRESTSPSRSDWLVDSARMQAICALKRLRASVERHDAGRGTAADLAPGAL